MTKYDLSGIRLSKDISNLVTKKNGGGEMEKKGKMIWGMIFVSSFLCAIMVGKLALAQDKFPTKPVSIIVPWSAGGAHDLTTRALQPHLEKILGQPVIVINRPGAGATIGFGEVMNSPPDGYTLGIISPAFFNVKHTIPKAGIDYVKFEPIVYVGDGPNIIAVKKDAPWNTLKEFLDYSRKNPQKVSVGNGGYGGTTHIFAIGIEQAAGVKFIHVPYKGTAPSFIDLLGGHVHAIAAGLTDTFSLIKGDKVKALGVTPDRSKLIPNAQSFKELGLNVDFPAMYAFLGPKGIPKERVNTLYNAFKKSTETKDFLDYFEANGATVSVKGPEDFGRFLKEKDRNVTELIVIGGIKPQ